MNQAEVGPIPVVVRQYGHTLYVRLPSVVLDALALKRGDLVSLTVRDGQASFHKVELRELVKRSVSNGDE